MQPAMQLAHFDSEAFLRESWQKKPLLIRNPWISWQNPLDPEELAGLACEAEVESRLVTYRAGSWSLEHGPLAENRFGELGDGLWSLLVQGVDHHVPAVAALLAPFRFVPDWRIDDVMVSYAVDGGGVGPHFDQYDVFLIQGLGRRRWQIGGRCDAAAPLLPHGDLRLLADFAATDEWVLEPGDILYLPPGFAHNGIAASDDCMTYSIGFRAPSRAELIAGWAENVLADLAEEDRYADPDLSAQQNPGEITPMALDRLHAMVIEKLGNRSAFAHWFAGFSTIPKYPDVDWRPEDAADPVEVCSLLGAGARLIRNPASRFAFLRQDDAVSLFVDGGHFPCSGVAATFAEQLCADTGVSGTPDMAGSEPVIGLVVALLDRGNIAFDSDC